MSLRALIPTSRVPTTAKSFLSWNNASSHRASIKATHAPQGRADRLNATKQIRERKRAEVLEARRAIGPPRVIALLPLSDEVDVQAVWNGLLQACLQDDGGKERALAAGGQTLTPHQQNRDRGTDDANAMDGVEHQALVQSSPLGARLPLAPITVRMPDRKKVQFTFLPPPLDRSDPLMVVELGRAAESVLFLLPGDMDSEHAVDEHGSSALGVLRALGMPTPAGLVQLSVSRNTAAGAAGLKERSAAKKRATEAFTKHIPGDHRMMHADTPTDFKQVLRHLADAPVAAPHWRRERPQLVVHDAHFESFGDDDDAAATAVHGRLYLTGYVRGQALSAASLVHVPGAGDFQIDRIEGPPNPPASNEDRSTAKMRRRDDGKTGDSALMEIESDVVDGDGGNGGNGSGGFPVLARVEAAQRESLQRENEINPLDAEQTWPTEEELAAAEAKARLNGKRRLLPRGTSEYQAAWILDDVDDEDYESDGDAAHDQGVALDPSATKAVDENSAFRDGDAAMAEKIDEEEDSLPDLEFLGDGGATEADGMEYIAAAEDEEAAEERAAAMRARREAEEDDARFPDEVEVPIDVPARQRFARYRGLKSFRTSPWDPREDLPPEYARVFAFENFRRAHRRARDAIAAAASQPGASVSGGTFVRVVLDAVPAAAAQRVVERVRASTTGSCPVLTAFGLLQHETKLSVVNYTVRKTQGYTEPVANKEELLFVTGIRSFPARPVFSTDEHGADKHKLERFLHEGRSSVATVFAPICYPPMPLLAFKQHPRSGGSGLALAASGALRDCNPDRVVVKKIVLTGYPVRQHKSKAVVRFMFHHPDDVRWFRPVELWTKQGRRGRIREPVGTHGTMKCIFDGAVSQQDAVCMSLYKRVFPKWPQGMTFA